MIDPKLCGTSVRSLQRSPSPFARVLVLGYYDGATSGIAECRGLGEEYRFEMLDWDSGQDVRIFELALLPPGSLDKVARLCPGTAPAGWVSWCPTWQFATEADKRLAESQIEGILDQAGAGAIVLATEDLTGEILSAKDIDPLAPRAGIDWFAFLGISRH